MKYRIILSATVAVFAVIVIATPNLVSAQRMLMNQQQFIRHERSVASSTFMRSARVRAVNMEARYKKSITSHRNTVLRRAQSRIEEEIARRTKRLEHFMSRVGNTHMSDTAKNAIHEVMQRQIIVLQTLKAHVSNNSGTTTLRSAIKTIKKSYRTFALVVPQGAIIASADRVNNVVSQMRAFSKKLQERIASLDGDTSELSATMADFNEKVNSAEGNAQDAVAKVKALSASNDDSAVFKSNRIALQDARKQLHKAYGELMMARKDAGEIVRGIWSMKAVSSDTSTSTSAQ